MEVAVETKVFLVHMKCEICNEGYMLDETTEEDMQRIVMMPVPKFPHKCNKCGHEDQFENSYPYQKLVPVEELENDEAETDN